MDCFINMVTPKLVGFIGDFARKNPKKSGLGIIVICCEGFGEWVGDGHFDCWYLRQKFLGCTHFLLFPKHLSIRGCWWVFKNSQAIEAPGFLLARWKKGKKLEILIPHPKNEHGDRWKITFLI